MPDPLEQKRILLGVTGSIACYKAVELASKLTQAGALVDVIMTRGASNFVTPLIFQSITHRPVVTGLFDPEPEAGIDHVAIGTDLCMHQTREFFDWIFSSQGTIPAEDRPEVPIPYHHLLGFAGPLELVNLAARLLARALRPAQRYRKWHG